MLDWILNICWRYVAVKSIEHELLEVQSRLSRLETAVISLRRDTVHTQKDVVHQQLSIDLLKERIHRIGLIYGTKLFSA